jgi:serine/threonine-protein kinase
VGDDGRVDVDRIVGTEVAGYAVESVLGRGAMGVVYVARQRTPDRRVALKLIAPAFSTDETFRSRFLRETTAAAAIEHPHILPIYDAGESDGTLFMAMRLVDGKELRDILRGSAGLPLDRAMSIVQQIGSALDAAHARGLVHRDVKPGNILVTEQPDADEPDLCYLTDFGVSMWTSSTAATITATGQMVGTANYVAPEQIEGRGVDGRADIYSLGCVLFECLTGRAPFAGRPSAGILYAHIHEPAPTPGVLRPDLPPGVDVVVAQALRKAPEERYASCRELIHDLRAAATGATSVTAALPRRSPPHQPHRRRSKAARVIGVVAAAALVIAGSAFAVVALTDRGGKPGASVSAAPVLIRDGVQVTATNTAPASHDASGNVVTYQPSNVLDGDVETAWRTPGNGKGESVTLIFDNPVDVSQIGLIPGYAKTDPQTGANRFFQDRIIEEVRYEVPGEPPISQTLLPEARPQFVEVNVTTSRIDVVVVATTAPQGLDYTAISEIYVYGYPQ